MKQPAPGEKTGSLKAHMLKGSAWMVAMRWSIRGIGLVSTVIMARLLTPADFGIVAMAMLVVGFLEVLSSFGIDLALIRNTEAQRSHFDTAWTFKILQGLMVALIIVALTPAMVAYFSEERLTPVAWLLALAVFINGFENIGIVAFRKELDFARDFKFAVITKLSSFFITVTLAVLLRNYWALVAGVVAGRVIGVIISYKVHPFRPRLSFAAASELWSFSKWMVLVSIANHIHLKVDQFIVGGGHSSARMGHYNVASELAFMPSAELIIPISRALLPGYAKLQSEPQRLAAAFFKVLGMVALLAFPASLGLMAVSDGFVRVVLGDKWLAAIPVIEQLAIAGIAMSFASITSNLLIAIGRVKWLAVLSWGFAFLLAPVLFEVNTLGDIADIALARACLFSLFAGALLYLVTRAIPLGVMDILKVIWRPLGAALIMVWAIKLLHVEFFGLVITGLIWDVIVGAIIYMVTVLGLWMLSGKPVSSEQFIVASLQKLIGKLTGDL